MCKCASVEINNNQYQCPVPLDTGADRWILAACIFAHLHIERRKRQSQQFLTKWLGGCSPRRCGILPRRFGVARLLPLLGVAEFGRVGEIGRKGQGLKPLPALRRQANFV